jgi:hypothetical protein
MVPFQGDHEARLQSEVPVELELGVLLAVAVIGQATFAVWRE